MCFKFIQKALGGLFGGGEADQATQDALDAARTAAETAATDQESTQQAAERRLKKLYASRGEAKSFQGADLAKAPTGVRMLLGT